MGHRNIGQMYVMHIAAGGWGWAQNHLSQGLVRGAEKYAMLRTDSCITGTTFVTECMWTVVIRRRAFGVHQACLESETAG